MNTELDSADKKLPIPDAMNSVLVDVIKEVYQRGYDDGHAELHNAEFVGEDKSKLREIEGLDNILNDVVKKYCL